MEDLPEGAEGEIARVLLAKDFYDVLDVAHNFAADDLRRAKRKMSLATHPDKHSDAVGASQAFTRVTEVSYLINSAIAETVSSYQLNNLHSCLITLANCKLMGTCLPLGHLPSASLHQGSCMIRYLAAIPWSEWEIFSCIQSAFDQASRNLQPCFRHFHIRSWTRTWVHKAGIEGGVYKTGL